MHSCARHWICLQFAFYSQHMLDISMCDALFTRLRPAGIGYHRWAASIPSRYYGMYTGVGYDSGRNRSGLLHLWAKGKHSEQWSSKQMAIE